jgi:hypothetical protein
MTTPAYDTDFYARTQEQAAALGAKDLAKLDLGHLAEEIDGVGASDRRAIRHQMVRSGVLSCYRRIASPSFRLRLTQVGKDLLLSDERLGPLHRAVAFEPIHAIIIGFGNGCERSPLAQRSDLPCSNGGSQVHPLSSASSSSAGWTVSAQRRRCVARPLQHMVRA